MPGRSVQLRGVVGVVRCLRRANPVPVRALLRHPIRALLRQLHQPSINLADPNGERRAVLPTKRPLQLWRMVGVVRHLRRANPVPDRELLRHLRRQLHQPSINVRDGDHLLPTERVVQLWGLGGLVSELWPGAAPHSARDVCCVVWGVLLQPPGHLRVKKRAPLPDRRPDYPLSDDASPF